MARILSGGGTRARTAGRPGFRQFLHTPGFQRVRRLFVRDPANGRTAFIGTDADLISASRATLEDGTVVDNSGRMPSPTIMGHKETRGKIPTKRVVARNVNRRLRKR